MAEILTGITVRVLDKGKEYNGGATSGWRAGS